MSAPPVIDLDSLFDSQPLTQDEEFRKNYHITRSLFKETATVVTDLLPSPSPEKTLAIRHLWYAMMVVNSALSRGLR